MKRAVKELLEQFSDYHLAVKYTRSGHLKVVAPNGRFVFMASTPGDRRNSLNVSAQIRRALDGRLV